jgi:hypothetical protein
LNPIPSLPAALRLDNQEQLLQLLQTHPTKSDSTGTDGTLTNTSFRQLLVFGTDSLRTLLMRQVLSDPHTRKYTKGQGTKKNWDAHTSFPLPKSLQQNIVGTRLLLAGSGSGSSSSNPTTTTTGTTQTWEAGGAEVSLQEQNMNNDEVQQVDVLTYFLRPWDLSQTQAVTTRIRSWKKKKNVHHRIVYVPQITALVSQVVADLGLAAAPNVSIESLQIDLFPLESDVISLEYESALLDEGVEGTPSTLIATCARSILKLQDIVGTIPRIQSLGRLGEEVLQKVLNLSVDEYLANDNDNDNNDMEDASSPCKIPDNHLAMMLMDRKVDMVTPMVTPLTYEGLLDEVVGIDCGYVQINC